MDSSIEPGSIEHLSVIISHIVAPAFLLAAVASFISVLTTRLSGVLARIREINALPEGHERSVLRADLPRLQRRSVLLNRSTLLAIGSAAAAAILILMAFAAALLNIHHVLFAAVLFMVSMALIVGSLLLFAMEVTIGLSEHDHR